MKKEKNKMNNEKIISNNGITLIALVITIIILLILAGVTINVLIGDNGLFKTAKEAGESYQIAGIRETVESEILAMDAEKITKRETLTVEQALIGINEKGTFEEIDLEESTGIIKGYIVTLGYNENGKVVINGIEKDIGIRITAKTIPSGYTNKNVEIEIGVKPNEIKVKSIEVQEGMTKKEEGKYEVTKNGNYIIKAILENGETLEKEVKIEQIDKLPPKSFEITAENTGTGFIINGETQDEEATTENVCSGIDRYEYIITDEDGTETRYEESKVKGLNPGKYQVYAIAYDKVGNTIKSNELTVKVSIKVRMISAGEYHSLAIDINGGLWSWGESTHGQLGTGDSGRYLNPTKIQPSNTFKDVSAGEYHSLAIDKNDKLWSWGFNKFGQLGDNTTTDKLIPVKISSNRTFKKVLSSGISSYAVDMNNQLLGWGYNYYGQLGDGTKTDQLKPVQIQSTTVFHKIDCGKGYYNHSLAIDQEGNLWSWGINSQGQVGDGTRTNRLKPVQIETQIKFKDVSAGNMHSLAIDEEGNLWSWGYNKFGQLGDGTETDQLNPMKVKNNIKFKAISAGNKYSLAIDEEGNLWSWGYNEFGQLGDNTTNNILEPTKIKTQTKFKIIVAGYEHSLAIDENDNLWAWGLNNRGQLGDGTTINSLIPIHISI